MQWWLWYVGPPVANPCTVHTRALSSLTRPALLCAAPTQLPVSPRGQRQCARVRILPSPSGRLAGKRERERDCWESACRERACWDMERELGRFLISPPIARSGARPIRTLTLKAADLTSAPPPKSPRGSRPPLQCRLTSEPSPQPRPHLLSHAGCTPQASEAVESRLAALNREALSSQVTRPLYPAPPPDHPLDDPLEEARRAFRHSPPSPHTRRRRSRRVSSLSRVRSHG